MGQTSKSDTLRPTWRLLKSLDRPESRISAVRFEIEMSIWVGPSETSIVQSRVCHKELIRSALKSFDPGVFNDWSNFIFKHFGADSMTFELVNLESIIGEIDLLGFQILGNMTTSKMVRLAPKCPKIKFDQSLNTSESKLSNAIRFIPARHAYDRITIFLWDFRKNVHFKKVWNVKCLDVWRKIKN